MRAGAYAMPTQRDEYAATYARAITVPRKMSGVVLFTRHKVRSAIAR